MARTVKHWVGGGAGGAGEGMVFCAVGGWCAVVGALRGGWCRGVGDGMDGAVAAAVVRVVIAAVDRSGLSGTGHGHFARGLSPS